jgi:hypothetical protein
VAAIVLGFAAAPTASAQDQSPAANIASTVTVGTRVRLVSSAIAGQPRGLVTAIDDSSLTLAGDTGPVKVPLSSITKLEASLGKRRNTLRGLAFGAASGMLISFLYPVDSELCSGYNDYFCSRGQALGFGAVTFGLIGTAIGALTKTERWGAVSLNTAPPGSGGQLGAAVAFTVRF